MIAWIQEQAQGLVTGGALGVLVREAIAFALKLRAARLRADADPANDAEAAVLEEAANKVAPK